MGKVGFDLSQPSSSRALFDCSRAAAIRWESNEATGSRSMPMTSVAPRRERSKPVEAYRMEAKRQQSKDATDLHAAHFIECVRSRKTPNADVEIGHRSTTVPHLGNIAYKTGHKLVWDAAKEDFVNDAAASKLLGRKARKPWDLI